MGIIIDSSTRVVIQGITGAQGSFHCRLMQEYGTQIIAGTSPGKGGSKIHGIPVYDTIHEVLEKHEVNASVVFVPAPFAAEAVFESLEGGIKTVVIITEHIPIRDTIQFLSYAKQKHATIIGPNTPGVISPRKCKLGIMPSNVFTSGKVGLISRSGTLTYEVAAALTKAGIGQTTCVGIGGDPILGLNFVDVLQLFKEDKETTAIVLVGEIGGNLEENAADYVLKDHFPKPVVAYVAGRSAPPGKRMGHSGAIVSGTTGTAQTKIDAFIAAGVGVAEKPGQVPMLVDKVLREKL
jgi:succinyl-CoA synthetase alpha subunit